jgi:TonB-dependent starch-binding outer membrane protein SusC
MKHNLLKPPVGIEPSYGFLILMLSFFSITAFAQSSITGQVTSQEGEALPGVNVVIKGSTTGTITDIDGNYRLNVPASAETLVFSFVGYLAQEVAIGSQSVIDVQLADDVQSLEEVVVVGFGTQKRGDLTGSVGSISGEEIAAKPINQP